MAGLATLFATPAVGQNTSHSKVVPSRPGVVLSSFPFYRTNLRQIPLQNLTHLVYAFTEYGPEGQVQPKDFDRDFAKNVAYLTKQRAKLPRLNVLLGIGGAGDWSSFFARVTEPGRVDAAAKSAVAFMVKHGFNGIDIDWEAPKPGTTQPANYVAYLAALRREMDALTKRTRQRYVLSTDVSFLAEDPFNEQGKLQTPPAAAKSVDLWNIMAYSMRGAWNCFGDGGGAGHSAALRPRTGDPYVRNGGTVAVAAWKRLGVPTSKMVLGIPFYGTLFQGVEPGPRADGLGQKCAGEASRQIDGPEREKLTPAAGYVEHYDARSEAAYRYSRSEKKFLSYENPRSIAAKKRFAAAQGLAGVMSWDLGSDDGRFTLLAALSR